MELNENAVNAIITLIIVWYFGLFLLLLYNYDNIRNFENRCIVFFSLNSNEEVIEESSEV